MNQKFYSTSPFLLESGQYLMDLEIQYSTYGKYIPSTSKVVWVCHALTANADVFEWWPGLFGFNELFNPEEYFIICANILGSCYGTTGPLSNNPETGSPYFHHFPEITIRDMVSAHILLADSLNIKKVDFLIGGSMGGQQALEWAIMEPERIQKICIMATNARHSPWGIAFNESQRMAIASDSTWIQDLPEAGLTGMKTARSIALLTYRNYKTYQAKQMDEGNPIMGPFKAATYQQYQGQKLANRFNAFSYWSLTKSMDSHNIARGRGEIESVLNNLKCPSMVVSFTSDILFPTTEQEFLKNNIPDSILVELDSLYGHDGFLIETNALSEVISRFL